MSRYPTSTETRALQGLCLTLGNPPALQRRVLSLNAQQPSTRQARARQPPEPVTKRERGPARAGKVGARRREPRPARPGPGPLGRGRDPAAPAAERLPLPGARRAAPLLRSCALTALSSPECSSS